jgi:hypothetical protein
VVSWLAACLWPPDVSKDYSRKDDWGISWLEMLFSFILFSNMYPPVKTGGQKADAIFWDYNAHEALLLPMAYVDPCCFQDLLYVPTGNFGHQNHHLGGHHSSVFIQEMFVSPSLQFFWYFCWSSLPALFA